MSTKYIYLIFSKTGTWLSKTIHAVDKTKYVHSSISFDCNFNRMYSFGRTNPSNPFSGGFVEESLFDGVYKRFPFSNCLIYRIPVTEDQYNLMLNEVEGFMREKKKYRYNFLGLFAVLLNKPFKRKYHYFCSQFVSELLIKGNIYNSNRPPELIKTNDLFFVDNAEVFYEGFVYECKKFNEIYPLSDNFTADAINLTTHEIPISI
ncbi:hypothetical protein [Alkaliphilus peptidifermentans]|uniref:Uncharacterized protein n=1 Tax=Alkaliphilus peptidifermentans DSM 18978 TaxID=1120976 RepID=A0A1G5FTV6_9FIRM|nr:hypothetical protein [Alkaliphilus peptidifermentans]SCY42755.1 hypothetical protein SAMN03080606_01489 [Alkaliphilus peptidifermentans DSM 18978]